MNKVRKRDDGSSGRACVFSACFDVVYPQDKVTPLHIQSKHDDGSSGHWCLCRCVCACPPGLSLPVWKRACGYSM